MSTETAEAPKTMPIVDTQAIDTQVAPFVERAKACTVTTVKEDEAAKKEFAAGKALQKFIQGVYKGPKDILNKAHKDMCAKETEVLAPVLEALGIYESKCLAFRAHQQRIAKEAADALTALAKKDAEELQLRQALEADAAGDKQLATEILNEAPQAVAISVQPALAKVEGVGTQKRWSAEVTDLKALVKYVAANVDRDPGVLCYIEPAMPVLNREAVNKKNLLTIPGVKANSKEGMSGRSSLRAI